ncbi:aldehyde dehydrogenase [Pelagibacterium nitratireducens]|uniref:Aldehyde dehydrogenase n=1 Tax=Pelagibacterium nitratireducens TaxID=1046114 RepID=A0ABZ2I1Z5_9HYPH
MQTYEMYIGGQWVPPASGAYLDSVDPYTGKPWARIPHGNAKDADRAVQAAHEAFTEGPWSKLTATQRGALLRRLGDLLVANARRLAEIEVRDNGKLMAEMFAQASYIPQWYYYFAGLADKVQGAVIPIDKPGVLNYTRREPVGVVVGITPWNSPLLLATNKIAPALAAGCTLVMKPSEYTSASLLEFARLVEEAGFPPGVFNVVTGLGGEIGEALVTHPRVAKVAFTGGELGGKSVYQSAARNLKKVSLELGGKSPNIVFDDANIDNAVNGAVSGIFAASGQTCIAGSRLLVQETIYDAFMEKLLALAGTAQIGDPRRSDTQVGPVTTKAQYDKILEYIAIAKAEGATSVLGGKAADRGGWFVEPTIFTNVTNDMRIAQEEVFGPVLAVIKFKDEDEAVSIANDVLYGLAAGVWTQSIARAINVSDRLQAGVIWVNTYRSVSYSSPVNGHKMSGIGAENGIEAIDEYLQTKSIWINTASEVPNPFIMRI